ncbi:MAG: DNA replication protein [Proteobacteria bacterium]|nr:DNA replication protein [Pseudomonadota bacterium]
MRPGAQIPLGLGHRPAMAEEDFLEAPCNAEALAWVRRWPDWPGPALAVYGPPGCGKSHLAALWRRRAQAEALATAGLASLLPALSARASLRFVLDDADGGTDERALLHLLNIVAEGGGALLLTAREAPARWPLRLADLSSRLAAVPAVAVGAPDEALIGAVLVKLFADRQLRVGREVVAFALSRMERSFDAARRLVAAVDEEALTARRPITVPLVRAVLGRTEGAGAGDEPPAG